MTREEAVKKLRKGITDNKKTQRKIKTYKDEYYSLNSILGNEWARFYYLLGGREAGKSYAVMKWMTNRKIKHPDDTKLYWFRLSEASQKKLLQDGASNLIDPDLKRKFKLKTCKNGNTVYTYKEETKLDKNGDKIVKKVDKKEFCKVMACSTFYNDKGQGYFDNEYKGYYICVLDEMNRERSEKNTFDIVYAFANQLETVLRSTKAKVKIIMIGNTLEETGDLLSNLNFIPDGFGRYKLKSKLAVVDYIKPNEKYIERRKHATANMLIGDSSTLTNEVMLDRSLLVNKRLKQSPNYIIKFDKEKSTWFTVWNNNIISDYNNENKQVIAMRRYLDEVYDRNLANSVVEQFDVRAYRFTTLATFKKFQKQLKLIKPDK